MSPVHEASLSPDPGDVSVASVEPLGIWWIYGRAFCLRVRSGSDGHLLAAFLLFYYLYVIIS